MFYFSYDYAVPSTGTAYVNVCRATSRLVKDNDLDSIRSPGDLLIFNTELKVKTAREFTNSFNVLNNYVKWRGDDYIEELFTAYEKLYLLANQYVFASDKESDRIKELLTTQLGNVIELLDIETIHTFITKIEPIPVPITLQDEFDFQIESNGLGTRDQTYIKSDYKYLMALIVVFKALYGPLAHSLGGSDDNVKRLPELQMLDILRQLPIAKHESFKKLRVYVKAVVTRTFDKEKIGENKILSTQLSKDLIPDLYLAKDIFSKMVLMDQMLDPEKFDIVRYLYKDINSKIKNVGSPDEAIRNKNKPSESEDEDKESVIESYRVATDVPPGIAEELNWATESVDILLKQLPKEIRSIIKTEDIKLGMVMASELQPANITNTHINILSFLFKYCIDPRGLAYLHAENIFNMIAVGYAILIAYDVKPLAYLLVSKRTAMLDGGTMNIVSNLNSTKAKGYRTEEIEKLFPVRRVNITKGNIEEVGDLEILNWVSSMSIEINKYDWTPPVVLNVGIKDMVTATLKNSIIDMLIEHERRL